MKKIPDSPGVRVCWISFIREFIAILSAEKRTHLKILGLIVILMLMTVIFLHADLNMH